MNAGYKPGRTRKHICSVFDGVAGNTPPTLLVKGRDHGFSIRALHRLTGLNASETTINVIGNNLANSNTIGYQSFVARVCHAIPANQQLGSCPVGRFRRHESQPDRLGNGSGGNHARLHQGTLQVSSNPSGSGDPGERFLHRARDIPAETLYTHDGEFQTNSQNELVTAAGNKFVLGYGVNNDVPAQHHAIAAADDSARYFGRGPGDVKRLLLRRSAGERHGGQSGVNHPELPCWATTATPLRRPEPKRSKPSARTPRHHRHADGQRHRHVDRRNLRLQNRLHRRRGKRNRRQQLQRHRADRR